MAVSFVNISRETFLESKLLYKHLPLEYALKTLDDSELWFSNPSTWKDPFERRFIDAEYFFGDKHRDFLWVKRIYCSCFTQTPSGAKRVVKSSLYSKQKLAIIYLD